MALAPIQLALSEEESAMLAGEDGEAVAMCMRIIVGVAKANGAEKLIEIESAHADGTLYHGEAGLDFTEKLVALGGKVKVKTTTNVGSLDLLHPTLVHGDEITMAHGRRLMDAHIALGCEPTWSCAPYQAGHRPAFGSHVAWAESNAIAFVNSVLGARSDRYGDFLDLSAAVTGRVPFGGLHHDAARKAVLVLDFSEINDELIEQLSKFHRNFLATNLNELLEETQEFYFMQGFDTAFASELFEPSDEFIKAIFNKMDGKKLTDNIKSKLKSLVSSNSIQSALLKVIDEESKSGNMVITTAEELKIYHTVKTILVHNKKIDADRITYRDQKNSFNVLVDDNNKKIVCKIISARNKYTIEINGDKFDYIGIDSIVKIKKQLLESALSYIE